MTWIKPSWGDRRSPHSRPAVGPATTRWSRLVHSAAHRSSSSTSTAPKTYAPSTTRSRRPLWTRPFRWSRVTPLAEAPRTRSSRDGREATSGRGGRGWTCRFPPQLVAVFGPEPGRGTAATGTARGLALRTLRKGCHRNPRGSAGLVSSKRTVAAHRSPRDYMPGMSARVVTVGAAQLGPIQRADTRKDVVERLLTLLHEAHERRCDLVVYPELALTTFFPRWFVDDIADFDHFYETAMPGPETQVLFDEARRLGVGLLPRLRRAERAGRRRHAAPLQHPDPRRARRLRRRPVPEGPPAGPRGARAGPARSSTPSGTTSSPGRRASGCGGRSAGWSG